MELNGYLSKFSLPEIFEFLEQGYKTGLLRIAALKDHRNPQAEYHYIWLRQGRIIAAANRLNNKGLISMIARRGWVEESLAKQKFQACGGRMTMGLCLKSQGLLTAEQLTLLFRAQIMGQVSPLFELENGKFDFDSKATIPNAEMTGLSMLTTEATIKSLRSLRNWSALTAKLPDPTSGILKKMESTSELQLDSQESSVLMHANGETSLNQVANQLLIPFAKVQQIAFRLIVSNLVEEVFIVENSKTPIIEETQEFSDLDSSNGFGELPSQVFSNSLSTVNNKELAYTANTQQREKISPQNKTLEPISDSNNQLNISDSFLQNLVGFLKTKVEN